MALSMCKKISDARSLIVVEREINALQSKINKINDLDGNEVRLQFINKNIIYKEIAKTIIKNKNVTKKFKTIINEREKNFQILLEKNSTQCAMLFSNILTNKRFKGQLLFDHLNKKLIVQVKNGLTIDKSFREKVLKSLRGGESSFSQIALLLSFSEVTESPVFRLDEFDVFMDQKLRKGMIINLIDLTKNKEQFIYITSQETK